MPTKAQLEATMAVLRERDARCRSRSRSRRLRVEREAEILRDSQESRGHVAAALRIVIKADQDKEVAALQQRVRELEATVATQTETIASLRIGGGPIADILIHRRQMTLLEGDMARMRADHPETVNEFISATWNRLYDVSSTLLGFRWNRRRH